MLQKINNFFRKSQLGQGIVEYALILAFVVAVAAVLADGGGIRTAISKLFTNTQSQIEQAGGGTNTGGNTSGNTGGGT